jgi:hypothetical protein
LISKKKVWTGDNTCGDPDEDYLKISMNSEYLLEIIINDSDVYKVQLEDPDGSHAKGAIDIALKQGELYISFIIVSEENS